LVPEGFIGRIQARRDVPPRYYPDQSISPGIPGSEEGWFDTGDRGFLLRGCLTVAGRDKEMIIVRGHNVFCHEIEELVNQVPGVERTFVGACAVDDPETGTEGFAVFFVPTTAEERIGPAGAIKAKVTAALGITPTWVIPLAKEMFPKTTSGKVQRTLLRKGLEAGEYDELIQEVPRAEGPQTLPETEVEKRLAAIWQEVLRLGAVGVDDNFFDLGRSSVLMAQMTTKMGEQLGCKVSSTEMFQYATIRSMAQFLGGGAPPAATVQSQSRGWRRRETMLQRRARSARRAT
jgi:acyl carrier protein